jgi:hypothetical protein
MATASPQVDARDQQISLLTKQLTELEDRNTVLLGLLRRLTPVLESLHQAGVDLKVPLPAPLTRAEQSLLEHYRACSQGNKAVVARIAGQFASLKKGRR